MPLYEYKCVKCQTVSEYLESVAEPVEKECSQCGGHQLEKIFSPMTILSGKMAERFSCDGCDGADSGCAPGPGAPCCGGGF